MNYFHLRENVNESKAKVYCLVYHARSRDNQNKLKQSVQCDIYSASGRGDFPVKNVNGRCMKRSHSGL